MALFSSVFRQLFERFAHFLSRRETPQRAQQCAAQELVEKLPEECEAFDYTANDRKCRKRRRKVPEENQLGERKEEREVGDSHKDEADIDRVSLEKIKTRGRVHQKKRSLAVPPRPTPAPDELFSIRRPSSQVRPPKRLPPSPTPAPDELFSIRRSSSQVRPPKRLPLSPTPAPDDVVVLQRPPSRKPQPFTSSPFEPPPELILVDIEEMENEYVEYTGKTIRASDLLKSERPQTPEAEMKPRKLLAWLEKDSEVQEEAWGSEVVEVQGFEEEVGDPSEMGDSKDTQGHLDDASWIDEHMMKLFCVVSPDGPKNETQHNVNVQKKCKRKVPFVLFTWVEEKAKKKKEKKIIKEEQRKEKELLPERYVNDPTLKYLWINKHNRI